MKEISKEEFEKVYDKYPPSAFVKFIYKYFSQKTEQKDMKLSLITSWILIGLFLLGFIGTIFELSRIVIGIATLIYSGILVVLVLSTFIAVKLNGYRLNKISKELGISKEEYNILVDKFYQ